MPPAECELAASDPLEENLESLVAFQRQEELRRPVAQRRVESVSRIIGSPRYLGALCAFAVCWVGYNLFASKIQVEAFDLFPFPLLAGLLALAALISTTVVLIAQNRQTALEQQRSHLALQVNLLTERKVTKLIHLLEELRRDLPMVENRTDPEVEVLQETADATEVLAAIEDVGLIDEQQAARTASSGQAAEEKSPKDRQIAPGASGTV